MIECALPALGAWNLCEELNARTANASNRAKNGVSCEPDDLLIRSATSEDREAIVDLLRNSLGEGAIPRNSRYWSWKHEENPFGPSPCLIAVHDYQIVGLRVFMRWTWVRAGREVRSLRAVDTATHPEWQGRGIFTRLTLALVEQMRQEGAQFVFNTPNKFSRPGYLKMGWVNTGRINLRIGLDRPVRIVRSLLARRTEPPIELRSNQNQNPDILSQIMEPRLERLLGVRHNSAVLATRLTRDYLKWRYHAIPEFEYFCLADWSEGKEVLLIYRIRGRSNLNELRFCEILVANRDAAICRAAQLIHRVRREIRPDYTVALTSSGTPEQQVVRLSGLHPAPRLGPTLTVRALSAPISDVFDEGQAWRLSIGDLELF